MGHRDALRVGGGLPGILNEHAIRSALGRPYDGYHSRNHEKAAALVHGIVSNHGFCDGNKRTALQLSELLIKRSNYVLKAEDTDFANVILAVAGGTASYDDLVQWFREHLTRSRQRVRQGDSMSNDRGSVVGVRHLSVVRNKPLRENLRSRLGRWLWRPRMSGDVKLAPNVGVSGTQFAEPWAQLPPAH